MFEYLSEPFGEDVSSSNIIRHAFESLLAEIAEPGVGMQATTEALMEQCLILVLRQHLTRQSSASPSSPLSRIPASRRRSSIIRYRRGGVRQKLVGGRRRRRRGLLSVRAEARHSKLPRSS